ncbi:MAG: hypothetical protein AB1468_04570 [Candidatus Micrarchaeota archaeon]
MCWLCEKSRGVRNAIRDPKVMYLTILFIFAYFALWFSLPVGRGAWMFLVMAALAWFVVELKINWSEPRRIEKAIYIGLFLMLFDFAVENSGRTLGYWTSYQSASFVLAVPVEVMLICVMGGAAWALYLPRKFNLTHSVLDILTFALFGSLGEYLLGVNGLLIYGGGWTSLHAFAGYGATWMILHYIRYNVLPDEEQVEMVEETRVERAERARPARTAARKRRRR